MILLIHCYSRSNSGDGLLVDLATDILVEAGAEREEITALALDAESFGTSFNAIQVPWAYRSVAALASAATNKRYRETFSLFREARAIFAVGGGYMRFGGALEGTKTAVAHLPQLVLAARSKAPTIYLPQSVGPAPPPVASVVRALYRQANRVYVRDDTSKRFFAGLPNVVRTPDLAALSLGEFLQHSAPRAGTGFALVARALRDAPGYTEHLWKLCELLPGTRWATQSTGRGNDDVAFMNSIGVDSVGALATVLQRHDRPALVISVRLHGALEALRQGVPAIHLSYERKGFGAYSDLGLEPYVFDARSFSPQDVAQVATEVSREPEVYWHRVRESASHLSAHRERLKEDLSAALEQRLDGT